MVFGLSLSMLFLVLVLTKVVRMTTVFIKWRMNLLALMNTNQRILFKTPASTMNLFIRFADVMLLILASFTAYCLHPNLVFANPVYYAQITLLGAFLLIWGNHFFGLYHGLRGRSLFNSIARLMLSIILMITGMLAVIFFNHSGLYYSRLWFVLLAVLSFIYLGFFRLAVMYVLRKLRKRGYFQKNILIVGAGSLAQAIARRIFELNWEGYKLISFLSNESKVLSGELASIPILAIPSAEELARLISEQNILEVWIALPMGEEQQMREIHACLDQQIIRARYFPDVSEFGLVNYSVQELLGLPSIDIKFTPMIGMNRLLKACEDKVLASVILLLISPLMLLIACAVKLNSKGPVFYRQERLGWNGKSFQMLKFRSMPVGAEQTTGAVWAKAGENRATKVGAFLRKTSLDELPQFINVLKGEMSIVGPRPERPVFVEGFKKEIPGYMQKHLVKAGITGWAQVNGWRGNTSLTRRIEYDLFYINHWSLFFDLKIIILTIFKGFFSKNAY